MRLSQQPPSAALVIGILSVAAVALPAIGPQWMADGLTIQPALAQSGAWAFQETFDGAPGAPQPFSSPRWQVGRMPTKDTMRSPSPLPSACSACSG